MRIALVGLTYPFRGGIAHYTTLLYQALSQRHEVTFYALSRQYPGLLFPGQTQLDQSDQPLEVPHDACIDSMNPLTWSRTGRRIREDAPDFVLFSWWHPFFAPAFGRIARIARRAGIPSCFLCHNALPHESTAIDRMLLRYAFNSARAFIAHSREDEANLRLMRPKAPIFVNPHPTYDVFAGDAPPDAGTARAELGLADKKVLLFFGYIRAYKGLRHLLEAMKDLSADDGYHLLVVGEFYEKESEYQPELDQLRERGQLTLVDRYVSNEEVPRYFAAADLVTAPYVSATQSGVVQIAFGFSKPVVATDVGGIPEAVRDGQTGFIVPPQDPPALCAAIKRFFDEDRADAFRDAIEREKDLFSWDRMIDTVEAMAKAMRTGSGHA